MEEAVTWVFAMSAVLTTLIGSYLVGWTDHRQTHDLIAVSYCPFNCKSIASEPKPTKPRMLISRCVLATLQLGAAGIFRRDAALKHAGGANGGWRSEGDDWSVG